MHGSYYSAEDLNLLKQEKEALSETLGFEVKKNRQHWLRYSEKTTPYAHNELFEEDSTIGWNNSIGFRAGILSRYRPYDHDKSEPFNYFVVPQVVMDSNLFDYSTDSVKSLNEALELVKLLYNYKNAHVLVSWHPRTCSSRICLTTLSK